MSGAGDREAARAFARERTERLRAQTAVVADTRAEVRRSLEEALTKIKAELAGTPSEFAEWRLNQLRSEIERVLNDTGRHLGNTVSSGLSASWRGGADLVDQPLAKAGVATATVALDETMLRRMSVFCTHRLADVTVEIANKIGGELGLVMIGAKPTSDAIGAVADIVGSGRDRALTIVRTELGRAYSAATQARMEQSVAAGVRGLRKQWRRSGKRHPRHSHEAIDGQVRPVDQPFDVAGVKLMYPRDPNGPAKETINCGCVALPLMPEWEVFHPKEAPFTRYELATDPTRRLLEDARVQGYARWVDRLASGETKADGRFETVGRVSDVVADALKARGITPVTREIAVADKQLLHALRSAKATRGAALPVSVLRDLPALLESPRDVRWDRQTNALVYVLDAPTDAAGRPPRVVVKARDLDRRMKHKAHNWIVTAGYEEPATLASRRFEAMT